MKCKLRLMEEKDLEMVLAWRNNPAVRHNMYTSHEISYSEHLQWWQREDENTATVLLIAEIADKSVGVVTFTNIENNYKSASWAFYSGDMTVRGVGSHMEIAALHYAFTELKLNRLECEVLDFNYPVVMFHRKFGFVQEGIKREAFLRNGSFYDIYCLSILKKDWDYSLIPVLKKLPKLIKKQLIVDSDMVASFATLSGDCNPIHLDRTSAQRHGFSDCIVHGMLMGSLFSSMFTEDPFEVGVVYLEQSLKFIAPLLVNTEIEINLSLISQVGRKCTFTTTIKNEDSILLEGEAKILLPKVNHE
jgi:UDP-4-amino-4,6-dideoxy-N-acetyl-beta-L-altrosamine N-acetyltransferase